jgi:hypothetical protein
MSRLRPLLLSALWFLGAYPIFASNYVVGTCRPDLKSFTTISAAVAGVPAGSTVYVCPGTYAEQVTISQPLDLEGLSSGQSDQVIVAATEGLATNVTTLSGSPLAAQILVTAGPVTIHKITVDGAGNGLNGSAMMAGIYFGSGASGLIGGVTTRNQISGSNGVGIFVENGNSASESVTIQNSSVHDFDYVGVWVDGNVNATVQGNFVSSANQSGFTYGMLIAYPDAETVATVKTNVVTGSGSETDAQGITSNTPNALVADNTVTGWYYATADFGPGTYKSNSVRSNEIGMYLGVAGSMVQANTITQSYAALDFNCNSSTTLSNDINDASVGMYLMPSTADPSNDLLNVATIQSAGCSAPAVRAAVANALGSKSTQIKPALKGGKPQSDK